MHWRREEASPSANTGELIQALERLRQLREKGMLTDAEFQ
jgi:hypothetical protein